MRLSAFGQLSAKKTAGTAFQISVVDRSSGVERHLGSRLIKSTILISAAAKQTEAR
jgi:hypothetical protein